jgi:hypothetical protein
MPSISYSTFISEPRSSKPILDDKPISFSETPAYSCGNCQKQSYPSVDVTVGTNILGNADELNTPLRVNLHPPFGMESVSQSNSFMYDTPKKVVSQSLGATLVLDNGTKMKPTANPCITPSHQSQPITKSDTRGVENKSVPSHNHAVSIASEITYDIPRTSIKAASLCEREKHPPMPKYYDPFAFGAASTEYDSGDASNLLTLAAAVTCTKDRTKPLSEMINSHPLLKHQQVDHNSLSYENTPLQCTCKCGSSSPSPCSCCKVAHGTTLKSDLIQSNLHDNTHQQGCLGTTILESSTPTKWNDATCQGQTIEYSQVISASMNRAQTLIARNIQELKQLDCDQVFKFTHIQTCTAHNNQVIPGLYRSVALT